MPKAKSRAYNDHGLDDTRDDDVNVEVCWGLNEALEQMIDGVINPNDTDSESSSPSGSPPGAAEASPPESGMSLPPHAPGPTAAFSDERPSRVTIPGIAKDDPVASATLRNGSDIFRTSGGARVIKFDEDMNLCVSISEMTSVR
jgi:hypothetical protein